MRRIITLSAVITMGLIVSCTRENPVLPDPPPETPGPGGKATIRVSPQVRDRPMDSTTIYVYYLQPDTTVQINDSARVTWVDGAPRAVFKNLQKGNYHFWGHGYDVVEARYVEGSGDFRVPDTLEMTYDLIMHMVPSQ